MDSIQEKFKYSCPKHPEYNVEFLQVDNLIANQKYQTLFYCSNCIDQDPHFRHQNYQLIKQIISSENNQVLSKWPPVNDNTLLNKMIQVSTGQEEIKQMVVEIERYFTNLKTEIIEQINISQKKLTEQAQSLEQNRILLTNRYQALSQITELRQLMQDSNTGILQKEIAYRALLESMLAQKETITSSLESLLHTYSKNKPNFNSHSPLQIKQSVLKSIHKIDFFQYKHIQNLNQNSNIQNQNINNNIQNQNLNNNIQNENIINNMQNINNSMQNMNIEQENKNSNNDQNQNEQKLNVQLVTGNWNEGKSCTQISKNEDNQNQVIIKKQSGYYLNNVSDLVLEYDKKYIFRMNINLLKESESCYIGLMQDSQIDIQCGTIDFLSFFLQLKNNRLVTTNGFSGIDNVIKGNDFCLSMENDIEMRVCMRDQILEVLDYPNYHFKYALGDSHKNRFIDSNNFRLYIGLHGLNNKVILKQAFTVDTFI